MKTITPEQIEAAIKKFESYTEKQAEERIDVLTKKHPTIFSYFISFEDDELPENDLQILFFTGAIIVETVIAAGYIIPPIDPEELNEAYDDEDDEFGDYIENNIEIDVEAIIEAHNQPNLLELIYTSAFSDDLEDEDSFYYIRSALTALVNVLDEKLD